MPPIASAKTIDQKLMLKPGRAIWLINPPAGYLDRLGKLPENEIYVAEPSKPVDIIQLFARSSLELQASLPDLQHRLKPGGMIWVTYFKGTSQHASDIQRDSINAYAQSLGLIGVAMVSIDQDWSALRLKILSA